MPVQIHELVIRAAVADPKNAQTAEWLSKELAALRESMLRECLREVRKLLERERNTR